MYKELGFDMAIELKDIDDDDLDEVIEDLRKEKERRLKERKTKNQMIYRLTYIRYTDIDARYYDCEVGLFSSVEKIKEYVYEKIKETEQKNNEKICIEEDNDDFIRYSYREGYVTYRIDEIKIIS